MSLIARLPPALIIVVALIIHGLAPSELVDWRERANDILMRAVPAPSSPAPVVIVEIDDRSLAELGQWPFPRDVMAETVDRLASFGALIVMTVAMPEADRLSPRRVMMNVPGGVPDDRLGALPDHDETLAVALANSLTVGPVIGTASKPMPPYLLASFVIAGSNAGQNVPHFPGVLPNIAPLHQAYSGLGMINAPAERDGVVRYMPLLFEVAGQFVPSLALEVLRIAQDVGTIIIKTTSASGELGDAGGGGLVAVKTGAFEVATDIGGRVRLYPAQQDDWPRFSLVDVVQSALPSEQFSGAVVLVGVTANGVAERFTDPLGQRLSAVELHAGLLEQLISERLVVRPDWASGLEAMLILVFGSLILVLCWRFGALLAGAASLLALAGVGVFWVWAFASQELLLDPILPGLTTVAVFLSAAVMEKWLLERRAGWIKRAFASYVSPNLVDVLSANPGALRLGGERRELSFVFTDLAGFTSLVEKLPAATLPPLLSGYLDGMTRVAFEHGGTIDKFVGDAVHIIFGAPVDQPDHHQRAWRCALALQRFAAQYASTKAAEGIALGHTRIGVNSGPVVIGNFGGDVMFDYTAHGDAINTAARLESANAHFGTLVCISDHTARHCPGFQGRRIGWVVLKGKTEPLLVHEPWTGSEQAYPEHWEIYERAFELQQAGDARALSLFDAILQDHPDDALSRFHRDRLLSGQGGRNITLAGK